jgi:hypothetical protein
MSVQCSAPTSNHFFVWEAEFPYTRLSGPSSSSQSSCTILSQARIMQIISINVRRMKTWQEKNEQDRKYDIVGLRLQDEA